MTIRRTFEQEDEFLRGVNVRAPECRDYPLELVNFLQNTKVRWVRIHPLPSRRLRAKNSAGTSYLDAISKFAEAGFNLILPIDVGVKENVGVIAGARLRKFVDESYTESFKAVKQIEARISKFGVKVIYGIENEIDTKEWIVQSMPTVAWRETAPAWAKLAVDQEMKYRRLGYILEGVKEAAPDRATMVNFEADDPQENWNTSMSFAYSSEIVAAKLGLIKKNTPNRMNNYRMDIRDALRRLKHIDVIGLDNYPNYLNKVPPRGEEIGGKVNEVAREMRKPVINVEFGYTSEEPFWKRFRFFKVKQYDHSLEEYQLQFFKAALGAIENSASQGTFPWVLWLDPARAYKPTEEKGFSLLKLGSNGILEPVPALNYYFEWLERISSAGKIAAAQAGFRSQTSSSSIEEREGR